MARPIKETPVLKGRDAKVFEESVRTVKPLPNEVKERIKRNYEKMKALGLK